MNLSSRLQRFNEPETLKMAKLGRELRASGIDVIDLSLGEPDFDTPEHIKDAAIQAVKDNWSHYPPVAGYPELREAACYKFKRDNNLDYKPENIIVSTGAKQSLANAVMAVVDKGDEVIIPTPYWVTYSEIVKLSDGDVKFVRTTLENNFKITPQELEAAIELLGANISVFAGDESITLYGSTLAKNYNETMALVEEILLSPRWDEQEFHLAKQKVKSNIQQQKANPNSIASNEFRKLIYGEDNILSHNNLGTLESVEEIKMEDLQEYYFTNLSPQYAAFMVVGAIKPEEAIAPVQSFVEKVEVKEVDFPEVSTPAAPKESRVYFYDVPGAKQSVFRFGYPALAETHPDFFPATIMNYRLGGGSFASQLTQELREGKGYTYGIRSSFQGSNIPGPFEISSGVRTNITYEAAELVKQILENYGKNYNENDLEVTKSFMIKSNARKFETLSSKLSMLSDINEYNWPHDYVKDQEKIVKEITVDKIKALASKYLNPNQMYYVIVGDAETQLERLEGLGFGEPVLLEQQEPEMIEE